MMRHEKNPFTPNLKQPQEQRVKTYTCILDRSRFIELQEQKLASGLAKAKIIPRFINELKNVPI